MNKDCAKFLGQPRKNVDCVIEKNTFTSTMRPLMTGLRKKAYLGSLLIIFLFLKNNSYAQLYMGDNSTISLTSGSTVYVNADLQTNGGTVNLFNNGDVRLTGNFLNNATGLLQSNSAVGPTPLGALATSGTFHFQGTSQQFISGHDITGNASFVNLEINNQNATPLVYQSGVNVQVDNILAFTNGRLRTDATPVSDGSSTKEIYITNVSPVAITGASAVAGATNKFIEGRLRWNLAAGLTYVFPIGTMKNSAPSGAASYGEQFTQITNTIAGDLSASFTELYGPNALSGLHDCVGHLSAFGTPVTCLIHHGHWNVISPVGSSMSVNLTEAGGTECQAGTKDHTFVSSSNNGSTWSLNGNNFYCYAGANPGTALNGLLKRAVVTGTSNWLGVGSSVSPILPIELIDFVAQPYENIQQSLLKWSTATEQNSKEFDLEWSLNGINWQTVGVQEASGNSETEKDYSYVHTSPAIGINYYQLKEVDDNGDAYFSDVREVTFTGNGSVTISPNPATSVINIRSTYANTSLPFDVIDVLGRRVTSGTLNEGNMNMDLKNWTSGMYYFRFYINGTATLIPVVKQQ